MLTSSYASHFSLAIHMKSLPLLRSLEVVVIIITTVIRSHAGNVT